MAEPRHLKSKICLVGEAAVGKTSLIRRYVREEFSDNYLLTLGTKISKKTMEIAFADQRILIDMSIWDIMGQPGLLNLLSDSYFTGANGILAVADLTRLPTLDRLEPWIRNVRQIAGHIPVFLAVNKVDLVGEGVRWALAAAAPATRYANGHVFTSAKTGENVEEAFRQIAVLVAKQQMQLSEADLSAGHPSGGSFPGDDAWGRI